MRWPLQQDGGSRPPMTSLKPWHLVALARSAALRASLSAACAGLEGIRLEFHGGSLSGFPANLSATGADVLLIELEPGDDSSWEALAALRHAQLAGAPIIASARGLSVEAARRLLRLGVADILPQPVTREELLAALDQAARAARQEPETGKGRVVAFLKAIGGAGATTLAVQAAAGLASRRGPDEPRVCLFDLDLQFGTVALFLDLDDRVGLGELLETPERLDAELLRSVMAHHESGLDVLAAPRDPLPVDAIGAELVESCLALARRDYGLILLDLPKVWTPWIFGALRAADLIVLVTQLTVPGVRHARRQLETLHAHGLAEVPLRLVVNRYRRRPWARGVDLRQAERALGRRIDHLIASDEACLSEAQNRGVPLASVKRGTRVEADLLALAEDAARTVLGDASRTPSRADGQIARTGE